MIRRHLIQHDGADWTVRRTLSALILDTTSVGYDGYVVELDMNSDALLLQ